MNREHMKAYVEEEKAKQFMWLVLVSCLALVLLVVLLTKAHDREPDIGVQVLAVANRNIEGYYDMYSKALTQHSRDRTIKRIKEDFKDFDATLIINDKYRNFLINTRNN